MNPKFIGCLSLLCLVACLDGSSQRSPETQDEETSRGGADTGTPEDVSGVMALEDADDPPPLPPDTQPERIACDGTACEDGAFCARVASTDLDFGEVSSNAQRSGSFELVNCGQVPWSITQVSRRQRPSPFQIGAYHTEPIEPGERAEVELSFGLGVAGGYQNTIVVDLDDRATLEVPVMASLVGNRCPFALVSATFADGEPAEQLRAEAQHRPQGHFSLSAHGSNDHDGYVAGLRWEILEHPPLVSGTHSPVIESRDDFALALPSAVGLWDVQLTVIDDQGDVSCEPARVRLQIEPADIPELFVRLTWETPSDPEQDTRMYRGSWAELSMLRAEDQWFSFDNAASLRNTNPNWGDPRRHDDDPLISSVPENSRGPETLSYPNPESGIYWLGARFAGGVEFEEITATIDVYWNGEPIGTLTRTLEPYQLWNAASLRLPEGELTPNDVLVDY